MPQNCLTKISPRSAFHATNWRRISKVRRLKSSDNTTRTLRRQCASRRDSSSQLQIRLCTCRNPDAYLVEDSQYCIGCGRPVGKESNGSLNTETSVTAPRATSSPKANYHDQGTAAKQRYREEEDQAEVDWHNEEEGQIFEDDWFTPIQLNPKRSWPILTTTEKAAPRPRYKEIRLLQIAPGLFDDPISCTRITTPLPTAKFEAVSYTWADETGNGEYSETVTCDGIESLVTRNGASLLRHVRLTDRVRTIWMDQLCINQSDNYEKSWQVQLMPEIYEQAEEVLIFAGPEVFFPEFREENPKDDAYLSIIQLRWFSRVWVLQEVARAKKASVLAVTKSVRKLVTQEKVFIADDNMKIGDVLKQPGQQITMEVLRTERGPFPTELEVKVSHERWTRVFEHRQPMPWEEFRSKVLAWHQKLPSTVKAKHNLPGALNLQMQQPVPYKELHGLLLLTRSTYSGDPRDKVFALFGIIISAAEHGLVADYTKTTELVFTETAWYIIRTTNTLEILSTRYEGTSNFQLASWVPDWTKPSVRSLRSDLRNRWDDAHPADHPRVHNTLPLGGLEPSFHCNCNTGELQIKGYLLDTVIFINENCLRDNVANSSNEVPMVMPISLEASTDCSLSLNYWDQWAKLTNKPLFFTEYSTGFSQSQPEIGDEVWQLDGADILFVLRKHKHAYKLITECFLWGVSYHACCWEDPCERFLDDGSRVCAGCLRFRQIGLQPPVDITIC